MMLVTHRGPFRFSVRDDGGFEATRGAGGVVSALLPLVDSGIATEDARGGERVAWIAATIDDGDSAALAAGAATVPGLDLHLLGLDPTLHRLHYDIVSNATLWFLHHGLFDLPRRPRFDEHFRTAWDAYVAVNESFADAVIAKATAGETVMVHDYQLALVPGMVRAARTDLELLHFTHTPFCGSNSIRVLPSDIAVDLCRSMASVPSGFHTTRWAEAYQASARTMLGIEAPITASFATPLGPDPDALAEDSAAGGHVGCRRRARRRRRRSQAHPAHRPDRSGEEHRAGLPRLRPPARPAQGVARARRVRGAAHTVTGVLGRVPRVPPGGGARRDARQRSVGARRLAARRDRRTRRLRPQRRRLPSLRRAAREPREGRPQPRGQGGPTRERTRRRAVPVTRSRCVRRAR